MLMAVFQPRHRKLISSVALGCWLFAFFVAVVSGCEIVGELAAPHHATTGAIHHHDLDDAQTGCEQFCANDISTQAKVKSFQHQPGGQLSLTAPVAGPHAVAGVLSASSLPDHPDPPPDLALYARFLRFVL